MGEQNRGADVADSMWMKDRFHEPLPNEYRDVILQIKVPNTDIWAEIQFHVRDALNFKHDHQHEVYGTMRHFPNAMKITEAVRALLPGSKAKCLKTAAKKVPFVSCCSGKQ